MASMKWPKCQNEISDSFGGTLLQTYTVLMEVYGNDYEIKSVNFGW